ncbi:MAG: M20/M25/M40 family metallo-hydrolase [Candidatus Limnocylindria bacterium]|nr:M20/M25/M40 family metallo-hydrolase [Candidatus Limnocylindria bacterium]
MDELDRWIAASHGRFTAELRELCAIPSEGGDDAALDTAARWCRDRLAAAGCADAREIRADGAPALVVGETGGPAGAQAPVVGETGGPAGAQGPLSRGNGGECPRMRTLIGVQHYDVQPAVPLALWASPPYAAEVRDGALYARGADDNKGHLLLRIQAVEAHRAVFGELPIRLRFLIEGEEESASPNLARLLAQEPALLDADGALKEGGGIDPAGRPQLFLGGKGIFYVELRVRSMARDAHSGGATHLPNAAWRLVEALGTILDRRGRVQIDGFYDDVRPPSAEERARVAALRYDAAELRRLYEIDRFAFGRGDDEVRFASVFEPTANICGIWSGYTGKGTKTVIPSEAAAKIDFRLVPDQDPERIRQLLRAHLDRHGFADIELDAREGTRPYRGAIDDPLVRATKAVAEEAFGAEASLVPSSGGTSPMWVVCHRHALANVTLGMGHPGAGAHAPNEHILFANYWRALRATARLYSAYATQE